jgi:hypothetical protein
VNVAKLKRAEMRRHLKVAQQLKVGTLVVVALLLLAAYPIYLFTRSVAQDPVFSDLDRLDLPGWATAQHSDAAAGSRWCINQCRHHTRTWASERGPDESSPAYETALFDAGWRPRTEGICPPVEDGLASCWERDEYVLEMWVRAPVCPPARPTISPTPDDGPSAGASQGPATEAPSSCPAALITVKVFNAIDYPPAA